jgi:hypothetical protein
MMPGMPGGGSWPSGCLPRPSTAAPCEWPRPPESAAHRLVRHPRPPPARPAASTTPTSGPACAATAAARFPNPAEIWQLRQRGPVSGRRRLRDGRSGRSGCRRAGEHRDQHPCGHVSASHAWSLPDGRATPIVVSIGRLVRAAVQLFEIDVGAGSSRSGTSTANGSSRRLPRFSNRPRRPGPRPSLSIALRATKAASCKAVARL